MLQIIEHTPTRLVLRDRRPSVALVAALFTGISTVTLIVLGAQGIQRLFIDGTADLTVLRALTLVIFMGGGAALVLMGIAATLSFNQGITCVFDREAESLTISRVDIFRTVQHSYPIYGVARIDVETNDEVRAYGLFIVLHSGERVPLAAIPMIDREHMEHIVAELRAFLRRL